MKLQEEFEARFLPLLEQAAATLAAAFPRVKVYVEAGPTGSLTTLQGYDLYIDCLIPDVPADQPDNVALGLGIKHITTVPTIDVVDVCWGHPSGQIEGELDVRGAQCDQSTFDRIEQGLPYLVQALRNALSRGHPPDVAA